MSRTKNSPLLLPQAHASPITRSQLLTFLIFFCLCFLELLLCSLTKNLSSILFFKEQLCPTKKRPRFGNMGHDFISHPNGIVDQNMKGSMGEMSPKPATVYQIFLVHLSGLSQLSACKIRMMTK